MADRPDARRDHGCLVRLVHITMDALLFHPNVAAVLVRRTGDLDVIGDLDLRDIPRA
jgi:hypothetical protein